MIRSLDDTIAAIATPPGEGGIAVVRVSGPGAEGIARTLLRGQSGNAFPLEPRFVHLAVAADPRTGVPLDQVLAIWMPAPRSYTREDVLELQCHGGHAAARGVLEAVFAEGVRPAEPGEFTLRAHLRGRVDLVQAEAVLDVIRARSDEAHRVHLGLLEGRLSRTLEGWQEDLGRALVALEASLDFGEEDLAELDPAEAVTPLERVIDSMEAKLASAAWGRGVREGFTVALVGSPNTGKSSLLNALVEEDRAIVSPVPGTTRDLVEGWGQVHGVPLRLVDTAGLRATRDQVEEEGVRRARLAAGGAHLVLLVCDGGRELTAEEEEEARSLAVRGRSLAVVNKADLGAGPWEDLRRIFGREPVLVSALSGEGLGDLRERLREVTTGGRGPGCEAPLTRARHQRGVEEALGCLRRAVGVLEQGGFPEVAASEVHGARRYLAELLGWGTPEDVLEAIFGEFCVGK